jgi:prepilin-type N-terminal cleavage/methylation domain-containing protein
VRDERGYTLIEMLTVLVIFGTVMSALMVLLVQGTGAEVDMNNRFRAQQAARLALDKIRREAHCATAVTVSSASSVTLSLPSYCPTGNGSVTWCTVSLGTSRYGLYRKAGAACDSTGVRWADHLTTANVFAYAAQSTTSLAKLSVDFPIDVKPSRTVDTYELKDDIVLLNSTRS